MVAGKTHSEILSMQRWNRYRWYKTILPEEKEEAMRIVNIAGIAKQSAAMKNHLVSEEAKAKISASLTGKTHSEETKSKMTASRTGHTTSEETRVKLRAAWTPEKRAEMSASLAGKPLSEEHKAKLSGKNHHNWQGGISFEPYGFEFNAELKRQIRERDNHTCQECLCSEEQLGRVLDVHHIDYDKTNNSPENLIALCKFCHSQTNFSREDWTEYFGRIMEVSG